MIKQLERQNQALNSELTAIKASKNKMEIDLISNMTTFHKYEMNSLELINKNKQFLSEISRLEK